jgi:hypothetical protein
VNVDTDLKKLCQSETQPIAEKYQGSEGQVNKIFEKTTLFGWWVDKFLEN